MPRLLSNMRHALRLLRKDAAFACMAVLSIALGLTACSSVFSIFNGLWLRSLPYPAADRLVELQETADAYAVFNRAIPVQNLHAWQTSTAFSQIAGFSLDGAYLTGFGPTARVTVADATQSLASTLGIQPILGRDFLPEEDRGGDAWGSSGAHRMALVSYGFWRRYFGGGRNAIGKTIRLDNIPFTVIGVLPKTAVFPADTDVWVAPGYGEPSSPAFVRNGVGRLKPGVTLAQASADLLRIQKNLIGVRPANRFLDPVIIPLRDYYLGDYRAVSRVLLGVVGFVLLIACLNVSGLMLARGTARAQEFAIRAALGASRAALIQQLLAEALLVASFGGAVGSLAGWAAVRGLVSFLADKLPSWVDFGIDAHFLWFALAVIAAVTALSSIAPAFDLSKASTSAALASGGLRASISPSARRGMNVLVMGEITVTVVLLAGGGLVLKAFQRILSVPPGFKPESALAFSVDPPGFTNDRQRGSKRYQFAQGLISRLRATPGVEAVGMTDALPITDATNLIVRNLPLLPEGDAPPDAKAPLPLANARLITAGYLRAMGVPLLEGRDFDEHDGWDAVIVNESLIRRYWPQGGAVGKRLKQINTSYMFTIVGVASDIRDSGLEQPPAPQIFQRYSPSVVAYMNIAVRGKLDAGSLATAAPEAARETDPNVTIFDVQTLRGILDHSLGARRAYTWLFGAFAVIALLLAVAGLYSVISYTVVQRTREIGIRMALGAQPRQVLGDVLRGATLLAAAGSAMGLAGAWFASRLLSSLLAGVSGHDPQTYVAVIALLAAAVLVAAILPARRAASVDPIQALKYD